MTVALLTRLAQALRRRHLRREARRQLHALDDRLLRDIGLRRDDIPAAVERAVGGGSADRAEAARRRGQTGDGPAEAGGCHGAASSREAADPAGLGRALQATSTTG